MKTQLEQRLEQLRSEFESGQQMLDELQARQASLEQTLLRISGAIQVLEELLADAPSAAAEKDVKRFFQPRPGGNSHK